MTRAVRSSFRPGHRHRTAAVGSNRMSWCRRLHYRHSRCTSYRTCHNSQRSSAYRHRLHCTSSVRCGTRTPKLRTAPCRCTRCRRRRSETDLEIHRDNHLRTLKGPPHRHKHRSGIFRNPNRNYFRIGHSARNRSSVRRRCYSRHQYTTIDYQCIVLAGTRRCPRRSLECGCTSFRTRRNGSGPRRVRRTTSIHHHHTC